MPNERKHSLKGHHSILKEVLPGNVTRASSKTINAAFDIVICGAGISGMSLAYALARLGYEVLVIDQSDFSPEHSSARSVALFSKSYAYSTAIATIIAASEGFLRNPPSEFESELLKDRDTVHVFNMEHGFKGLDLFNAMGDFPARDQVRQIMRKELLERVPILKKEYPLFAILETGSGDLDPHAMYTGFRRGFVQNGGRVVNGAELLKADFSGGEWEVETTAGTFLCRILVNAAGAWGDDVAVKCGIGPIGLQPYNRTAMVCQPEAGLALPEGMPFVFVPFDDLYFRVNGGSITMSPADEVPMPPCDAFPEEIDIARTMAKFEEVSKVRLAAHKPRAWAGQRTFSPDKDPVVGFDIRNQSFFWLVGQGGFGIESAWSLAHLAASILSGSPLPRKLAAFGLDSAMFSPARFFPKEPA